jgi:hypothetical protein
MYSMVVRTGCDELTFNENNQNDKNETTSSLLSLDLPGGQSRGSKLSIKCQILTLKAKIETVSVPRN